MITDGPKGCLTCAIGKEQVEYSERDTIVGINIYNYTYYQNLIKYLHWQERMALYLRL